MKPIALLLVAVVSSAASGEAPNEKIVQREIASLLTQYNAAKHTHGKGRESLTLAIGIYNLRAGQTLCEYSRGDDKQYDQCLGRILKTRDLVGLCQYASSARSEQCIDETLSFGEMRDRLEVAAYPARSGS